jgi:hypothetical protein
MGDLIIPETETLYLVCVCCGEAFETMQLAKRHGDENPDCVDVDGAAFAVEPESEAF